MKKFYLIALITSGVVILSSCCGCRSTKSSSITDETWQLIQLGDTSIPISEEYDGKYTLTFGDDNRFSGLAECNRYFGGYTITGNKIEFTGTGSTRMMCLNENYETPFLQLFDKANNFKVDGQLLMLLDEQGKILATFKKVDNIGDVEVM